MASPVQRFSRLDLAYKLAALNENCFLTIDSKDTVCITSKPGEEASCDTLMKRLIADLNEFSLSSTSESNLPKSNLPKNTLKTFKERTIEYFTKKQVPKDHPTYIALQDFHFPLAQLRWKYDRSILKYERITRMLDLDYESKAGERLLEQHFIEKMPNYTTDEHLDIIMFPRDVLFMRKLIKRYITEYTALQQEINDCLLSKFVKNVPVRAVDDSEAIIFGQDQIKDRERSLQERVRDASKKLILLGTDKEKFSSRLRPILKSLYDYQKLEDHDPLFFEECLEILELNERISRLKKLDSKWKAVSFSVRGFTSPDFVPFRSISYLLKRHLYFLYNLTNTYRTRVEVINTYPLEERVQQHCMLAQFYRTLLKTDIEFTNVFAAKIESSSPAEKQEFYKILAKTSSNDDLELYTFFANAIDAHARRGKNGRFSNLSFSQVIPVVSNESDDEDDDAYEEYTWTKTSPEQYAHSDSKLKKLEQGINLTTRTTFKEIKKEITTVRSLPKGFIDNLLPQMNPRVQRISKKKLKRKTIPSPPTSTSPEADPINTLCTEVAKVTLQPRTQSPETKKVRTVTARIIPKAPERQEVSAHLKYDPRVSRWNRERDILTTDPEYKETKFGSILTKIIYKEHNFTKFLDFYISLGIPDPKIYGRIQIYGEMIIVHNGKVERRLGTFTYSKDQKGLYFHRYFKAKGAETAIDMPIDPQKAAQTWETLTKTPLVQDIPTNPQQITRDRGYLVSEVDGIITIMDPTTDLFVDPSKPFAVDSANYTLLRLVR